MTAPAARTRATATAHVDARERVVRARTAVLAVAVFAVAAPAGAGPYAPPDRAAHLAAALGELRALGAAGRLAFERELHEAVRTACRAGARAPATRCMIEQARRICANRPAGCLAAADIVLTNQHAETDLVDERTRVRLVRASADYHAAIVGELRAQQALLAAELALDPAMPAVGPAAAGELAAHIDRFCAERDRRVHRCAPDARGCVPSLPWQRCAAGLAWFVAEDGGP